MRIKQKVAFANNMYNLVLVISTSDNTRSPKSLAFFYGIIAEFTHQTIHEYVGNYFQSHSKIEEKIRKIEVYEQKN